MDRYISRSNVIRLVIACSLGSCVGCIANPVRVPTVWDKLGIPQATAGIRDALVNRNGRFPQLEKKPPVLKLADPANLKPEKPEVIKTAAKIKTDQDLKKQKIKAIKFLAEVNCGCYNKDGAVEKAFLEALNDCDPDVRSAAIEGVSTTIGNCASCRNRCAASCCTADLHAKLTDIATGMDDKGCFKEPSAEIRKLASSVLKKCVCPPQKPIEEIPAPKPEEIEELVAPSPDVPPPEGKRPDIRPEGSKPEGSSALNRTKSKGRTVEGVSYHLKDHGDEWGTGDEPVVIAEHRKLAPSEETTNEVELEIKTTHSVAAVSSDAKSKIANPDHLISARVISNRENLGELLIELPEVYQISKGWMMVVVDTASVHHVSRITETSGRRILLATENAGHVAATSGQMLKIGLVKQ
ncbi:MAG: hypothetical protein SGI77_06685 [Pirellulaceae bacterium]|nr:hypothetical protein [Pirellulaceae bacterium]